jgi:hypothetical protein
VYEYLIVKEILWNLKVVAGNEFVMNLGGLDG